MNRLNLEIEIGLNRLEKMLSLSKAMMQGMIPVDEYTKMMNFIWKQKTDGENNE